MLIERRVRGTVPLSIPFCAPLVPVSVNQDGNERPCLSSLPFPPIKPLSSFDVTPSPIACHPVMASRPNLMATISGRPGERAQPSRPLVPQCGHSDRRSGAPELWVFSVDPCRSSSPPGGSRPLGVRAADMGICLLFHVAPQQKPDRDGKVTFLKGYLVCVHRALLVAFLCIAAVNGGGSSLDLLFPCRSSGESKRGVSFRPKRLVRRVLKMY